jgi:hypothetical protein
MATHASERHDISLQACAAARVGCGKYENDGRKISHATRTTHPS